MIRRTSTTASPMWSAARAGGRARTVPVFPASVKPRGVGRLCACLLLISGFITLASCDEFSSSGYGRGAAAYLDRASHAHSAGVGKAVSGWDRDLAGQQYNPAILDAASGLVLVGSYTFLFEDRRYVAADGVMPVGQFIVAGLSFASMKTEGFEQRDIFGFHLGNFSSRENNLSLSVAGRLVQNISVGARARYLNQTYDGLIDVSGGQAHGMGFDAGALWRPDSMVSIGASMRNIGSRMWWATGHEDPVLMQGRAGICGYFMNGSLSAGLDFAKTLKQPIDISAGLQYTLFGIVSIRGGATTSFHPRDRAWREPDFSLGLGVRYSFFGCDWAIVIPTDDTILIGSPVSLILRFDIPAML